MLETAARLFKIEFRRSTASAWHPAVSVFDVFDGGNQVGRFYLDMHPREGKDKWFSAAPIVTGVRGRALPEAALPFTVLRIVPVAEAHDGRMVFRVDATLDARLARLRPGMEGYAQVDAGRARLVWIWFRSLLYWLRVESWVWLP